MKLVTTDWLLAFALTLSAGGMALACMPKQHQPAEQDYRPQMQQSLDGNARWFASYKPSIDNEMAKVEANENMVASKGARDAQYPLIKKQGDSLKESWGEVQTRQRELVAWGSAVANPVRDDVATFGHKFAAIQQDSAQILTGLGRLQIEYLSLRGRLGVN